MSYSMNMDAPVSGANPDGLPVPIDPATPAGGSIEVDPEAYENYEEYYDDADTPVYEVSDCDSSIGIRG